MNKKIFDTSDYRIIITGTTGFIGSNLYNNFSKKYKVLSINRTKKRRKPLQLTFSELDQNYAREVIKNFKPTHLIHCAGMAHKNIKNTKKNFEKICGVNVGLSLKLADIALNNSIKRFIFISSIGIHGDQSILGSPINELSKIDPNNIYSISKIKAEESLCESLRNKSCDLCIIRPSIVYGQNAPGNIKKIVEIINTNIPLPFKGIKNRRSFLYVGNLVSALDSIIQFKYILNKVFVLSDKEPISIKQFVEYISTAKGKKSKFFRVPYCIIRFLFKIPKINKLMQKLYGDLEVDSSLISRTLNWEQPFKTIEGVNNTFMLRSK